jgi:hypothetical protein
MYHDPGNDLRWRGAVIYGWNFLGEDTVVCTRKSDG